MGIYLRDVFANPAVFVPLSAIVIFSICLHEYFHAYAALREGDDTAAKLGHLTLNPLRQMGLFSLITFALLGIAWGQVPVDQRNFRSKWSTLRVSLAGPLANLLLFLVFTLLLVGLGIWGRVDATLGQRADVELAVEVLLRSAVLNVVLLVFNCLPIPGLDGWGVAQYVLGERVRKPSELLGGISLGLLMLAFIGIRYVYAFGAFVTIGLFNLLMGLF